METEQTRQLIERWFQAAAARDVDATAALLAEDARVVWPKHAPAPEFVGRDEVIDAFTGGAARSVGLDMSEARAELGRIYADGDTAIVEMSLTAPTLTGGTYDNQYAMFYRFSDGLLYEIQEYSDTLGIFRSVPEAFTE